MDATPKIILYIPHDQVNQNMIRRIQDTRNLLTQKMKQPNIVERNVSSDFVLQKKLIGECKTKLWPLIYIDDVKIGDIHHLRTYFKQHKIDNNPDMPTDQHQLAATLTEEYQALSQQSEMAKEKNLVEEQEEFENAKQSTQEQLKKVIEQLENSESSSSVEIGQSSQIIETAKWIVSGAASSVLNPISWISSYWYGEGDKTIDSQPKTDPTCNPQNQYFPVIRTNWMWTQQKRVLCFKEFVFSRLMPEIEEERASFSYNAITKVVVSGKTFLNIFIKNGNGEEQIEHYQTASLKQILEILAQKRPDLQFEYSKEDEM